MSNASNGIKKRWIPIAAVLATMVVAGSFAIVPNTAQPTVDELGKKALLIGDATTGTSIFTTNTFMWNEDCQLSQLPIIFTVIQFECTKHTAVMKISGALGDRTEFTIDNVKCLASTPDTVAIVRANVGQGVLVDMLETVDIHDIKLTNRPNEWLVQVSNCDPDPAVLINENDFVFDLVLITKGSFEFDISIEEVE